MKLSITPFHFSEIQKRGFSLDLVFLLLLSEESYDLESLSGESARIEALLQTGYRKGLLTEDLHIALPGRDLLAFMESPEGKKLEKRKQDPSEFQRWWDTYPGTSSFEEGGRRFEGTRTLRKNREVCRGKFTRILQEGEYTAEELIGALSLQVAEFKRLSLKEGDNKLRYMQGSDVYLNQRTFEVYVERLRRGERPLESAPVARGGHDI